MTDDVLRITLDRPEKLNALRRTDIDAMRAQVEGLAPGTRAVVFSGTGGRAFSAGVDVDEFLALTPDTAVGFITALRDLLAAVRNAPAATVAVVDGHCLGGAFELAMACDLRIATPRSHFGLPEIKLGIPSVIDAALLERHVGLGFAREMILTGDSYRADDPRTAGLSNALVAPEELTATVDGYLAKLVGHTPTVLASQRRLFELWLNKGLAEGAELSTREFGRVFAADDTREALAAYRAGLGRR
ncbi:enoyl-CoA hydratase/isomerase family protein [Phaeacidiphilus oryzae]|jgi:enoyl-CoA hydratase/carnithine racemase|uniref:enoyl-CoA hydratase/isomerase family protein n=1 Tax=Phaeacidiphilus oryzae TaxID=348818 RepID=UPI00068F3881|nr:enoyl-CoA hydratase-related protein [Phaeacidiphilus oryzae]